MNGQQGGMSSAFEEKERTPYLSTFLKSPRRIIFEAFSKKHPEYNSGNEKVGGPKDIESLFSIEEVAADFRDYTFTELLETEIELNEGKFHTGKGSIFRFTAIKN